MTLAGAASAPPATHTAHLLLATGSVLLTLVLVALGERVQRERTPGAVLLTAGCSAAAGAIHLAVTPGHWAVAPVYGAFFLAAGSAQLVWSLLLLVRSTPALLALNVVANAGLWLLWLDTRTRGVPLGPDAGLRERVGVVDLACAALEVLAVAAAVTALRRQRTRSDRRLIPA